MADVAADRPRPIERVRGAGLEKALANGLSAARKLDIIVANQFADDAVTLAVWEKNRRLEKPRQTRRSARGRKTSAETPAVVPAPEPSPVAPGDPMAGDDAGKTPAADAVLKVAS